MKSVTVCVVRPTPGPMRWLPGVCRGTVLRPSLEMRQEDDGAWVLMARWRDSRTPQYLTPAGSLWADGLDHQRWFHDTFAVFATRDEARAALRGRRWGEDWKHVELARVRLHGRDVQLVPEGRSSPTAVLRA